MKRRCIFCEAAMHKVSSNEITHMDQWVCTDCGWHAQFFSHGFIEELRHAGKLVKQFEGQHA